MNTSDIQALAKHYANIPILDRNYRSVVHLEDESDKLFWDKILQKFRPGKYYYIYHTKKEGIPGGCTQCLKYRGFLSDKFFVCIDSDLRNFNKKLEEKVTAKEFILQTYTYSWENHFCYGHRLQKAMEKKCPTASDKFNFPSFLSKFSDAIYPRFLFFLIMSKRNFYEHTLSKFMHLLPQNYNNSDFEEQGKNYLANIKQDFDPYIDTLEENGYKQMGIDRGNTYLHIKGHYIYNLIKYIGKILCRNKNINFEKDILLNDLQTEGYWQIENIKRDIELL